MPILELQNISKHFGAGLPISAVCTTAELAERAVEQGYFATRSHACDPITCAAGVASIDIVLEENLCERAAAIERRVKTAIAAMARHYDFIGDVRGRGVLLGIELIEDRATRAPANAMCREAVRQCEARGLLVQARGSHARTNVIRLVPPMVCTDAEIDEGLAILDGVFATLAHNAGLNTSFTATLIALLLWLALRSVRIIVLDSQGEEKLSWRCLHAWPVKWSGSDLKGDANTVAIESLELAHGGLQRA